MDITGASTEFVTLAELKAHLNITTTTSDTELETFRAAAEQHVEQVIGPVLHQSVTQRTCGPTAVLHTMPLISVEGIVDEYDTALTGYKVNLDTGVITLIPAAEVVVSFTAGRSAVGDDVRLATMIIGKHLWETQRGRSANRVGNIPDGEQMPAGFLIPHRAASLLRPHTLALGFA